MVIDKQFQLHLRKSLDIGLLNQVVQHQIAPQRSEDYNRYLDTEYCTCIHIMIKAGLELLETYNITLGG